MPRADGIDSAYSTTSFQRPKWPQTKMHTASDAIFGHTFWCSFICRDQFYLECWLEKPLSRWWKFFKSQSQNSMSGFVKLTLGRKWITRCERAWKTRPENGVRNCAHFCLRPLEPLERCVLYVLAQNRTDIVAIRTDYYFCLSHRSLVSFRLDGFVMKFIILFCHDVTTTAFS